jgi:anti-sigma28 factor (negative regulator of flagellin synthesis)
MKIEGKSPDFDRPLDRVESTKAAEVGLRRTKEGSSGDHIRVSAEAQLAREAVRLAQDASDVRPEVVARAKALLESGDLGASAEALADALIEATLEGEPRG